MKYAKISFIVASIGLICAGCNQNSASNAQITSPDSGSSQQASTKQTASPASAILLSPIQGGLSRVTKKSFGTKVSPGNSPVFPERFSGYHTGIDFETYPDEQNIDVRVSAACTGNVAVAEYASGYGGVLVQRCKLDGNDVTMIYGHLRLASIKIKIGQTLNAGQQFAVLGTGYSKETDGERKHLHLGIHKGTAINIKGYVQQKSQLDGWLNPEKYLSAF